MRIELDPDVTRQAVASIKRYLREELELDVGELKAGSLLEYFLEELAPLVYNRAIADAQGYMQERALDLEGVCHADEFGYWAGRDSSARRRR
jgi:uncharacterized protein (DUF2164 family)